MRNILVVEDDTLSNIIFKKILEKQANCKVICTEDVHEILNLCHQQLIQLVIMDISLKNSIYQGKYINGVEITRLIKEDTRSKDIPVLLVTAHTMFGSRNTFMDESGADGYISKPVTDYNAFIETVNNLVSSGITS